MRSLYLILVLSIVSLSGVAQQTLVKDSIKSEILGQVRRINIVVPDMGNQQPGHKLNVVYVLDGDETFVNLVASHISFITGMESDKGIPAYLVVGVESENTRMDDFIIKGEYRETGRAGEFLDFMSDELFPYIESRYELNNHKVCIGHSLGGSLAMHALCKRDSMFNAYMLFSPNLVYEKCKLVNDFKAKVPGSLNKFVYVSSGDTGELEQGYAKGVKMLDSLIANSPRIDGFKIEFEYLANASHAESVPYSLGRVMQEYIDYSYGTPVEEERMALLKEDNYALAVKNYYDNKQKYIGYKIYPEVYPLYNDWITIAGRNEQFDKILQLAEWGITIHQDDFSTYILHLAKAETYLEKNDIKAALKACDDAKKTVESLRERTNPQSYKYALEEIDALVSEVKQDK